MSRLGQFAKRYEQVQRGLQDMAQRRLVVHRQSEASVLEQQRQLMQQKRMLKTQLQNQKTGLEWQVTWEQIRLLEAQEHELQQALEGCRQQIQQATDEVRKTYQEAERWDTLATREADREQFDFNRRSIQQGDDLAVQSHGRAVP